MALETDVPGMAIFRSEGGTGLGGAPTFSSVSFGFSTVATGGGGILEFVGGRSSLGGSLTAVSIFGGSGSGAAAGGGGAGGVGITDGRGATGREVAGGTRG